MNRNLLAAALITIPLLFLLNAVMYVAVLKDFFQNHPAVSQEFMKQLYKPEDQVIVWAAVLCSVAIGTLVTTVVYWSGARTFLSGVKTGLLFGILLLASVDFGLLASTNSFSTASAFADLLCSTITVTLSAGVSAFVMGRNKSA